MKSLSNPALGAAALFGFAGVALGAFGAHALKDVLTGPALDWWHTAVQYHLIHAAVLAAVALGLPRGRLRSAAVGAFSVGILVFSGSLYALALTQVKVLGAITPVGGLAFLGGWACLAWAALVPPGRRG